MRPLPASRIFLWTCVGALALRASVAPPEPLPASSPPPDAAGWWRQVSVLAGDGMEGREAGTPGYERAARHVADEFARAGLKPAGDEGTYFQRVAMHQIDVDPVRSTFSLVHADGRVESLQFLHDLTVVANAGLPPNLEGKLIFLGYGLDATGTTLAEKKLDGKIAVFFTGVPARLSLAEGNAYSALRLKLLRTSGAAAIVGIANPANIEPTRWPVAYARAVSLLGRPTQPNAQAAFTISAEAAEKLFAREQDYASILRAGMAGESLLARPLSTALRARLVTTEKDISSPNILAVLPGADAALAGEYVALSAHLDGYGFGTEVDGDGLYNGALDDAAYVATLTELAHRVAARRGAAPPVAVVLRFHC